MIRLVKTEDGSHTIHVPDLDEHYHSIHGAIQESEHVFINSGFNFCKAEPVRIFEVGLGTGLNVLLTCLESLKQERKVEYTAVEKYPLGLEITSLLNYGELLPDQSKPLLKAIHDASWGASFNLTPSFSLLKLEDDLLSCQIGGLFDLVYFDAFGPDKQPELWSEAVFLKIGQMVNIDGVLVTYSVKGNVQRALKKAGFSVSLLPGPAGKRHILRAVKI